MNRIRSAHVNQREVIAKKYNTQVMETSSALKDLPYIFKLALGKSKNFIKLREDLFLFEFHFDLLTAGHGSTEKFIQMVCETSNKRNKEVTFIRDSLFMQWPDSYSVTDGGYQCSYHDQEILRELAGKEISICLGSWGGIYMPNNGRIDDVDTFMNEIDKLKNTLVKRL